MEITWWVIIGEGKGIMGEKVQGMSSINGRYKIEGGVKNSIGNVKATELICTTHGCELRGGECSWEGVYRAEENKGREGMGQL